MLAHAAGPEITKQVVQHAGNKYYTYFSISIYNPLTLSLIIVGILKYFDRIWLYQ